MAQSKRAEKVVEWKLKKVTAIISFIHSRRFQFCFARCTLRYLSTTSRVFEWLFNWPRSFFCNQNLFRHRKRKGNWHCQVVPSWSFWFNLEWNVTKVLKWRLVKKLSFTVYYDNKVIQSPIYIVLCGVWVKIIHLRITFWSRFFLAITAIICMITGMLNEIPEEEFLFQSWRVRENRLIKD